jgi:hypothetical protein
MLDSNQPYQRVSSPTAAYSPAATYLGVGFGMAGGAGLTAAAQFHRFTKNRFQRAFPTKKGKIAAYAIGSVLGGMLGGTLADSAQ